MGRFRKVAAQGIARWAATGSSGGRKAFEVLEPSPVTLLAVIACKGACFGEWSGESSLSLPSPARVIAGRRSRDRSVSGGSQE